MAIYSVEIVAFKTGEVVNVIKCGSEKKANRVMDGMDINLNHEEYATRVVLDKPSTD